MPTLCLETCQIYIEMHFLKKRGINTLLFETTPLPLHYIDMNLSFIIYTMKKVTFDTNLVS